MEKLVFKNTLKILLEKRRFKDIKEIESTIKAYLRINIVDTNKYDIRITKKAETEMEEIPKNIDYILIGSIMDKETKEAYDFDLYYAKTRNNGIYLTEYIEQ